MQYNSVEEILHGAALFSRPSPSAVHVLILPDSTMQPRGVFRGISCFPETPASPHLGGTRDTWAGHSGVLGTVDVLLSLGQQPHTSLQFLLDAP